MSIIYQTHLTDLTKIHHYAKNITAIDFLELLSNDELLVVIEYDIPQYREQMYTPMTTAMHEYIQLPSTRLSFLLDPIIAHIYKVGLTVHKHELHDLSKDHLDYQRIY